jgi:hypothetical protein
MDGDDMPCDPDNDKKLYEDAAKRPFNPDGGEDEASTSQDGNDDHLHDDQKPLTGS